MIKTDSDSDWCYEENKMGVVIEWGKGWQRKTVWRGDM